MRAERRSSALVIPHRFAASTHRLSSQGARRVVNTFVMRSIFTTTVVGLLTTLLLGCVMMDTEYDDGVREDQRATDLALERQVMPKLLAALPPEERQRLGPVSATATVSFDPARIALEHDERKRSRLVVSTSFLSLQDALVEASVIASATTGHEQQLVDYSVMVARFALGGARVDPKQYPEPFWQYIGWTARRYETLSSDPRFEALRQRAMMQSLAWLAASLLTERIDRNANAETGVDSPQAATAVRQRTAELLLRARLAPVPTWSVAILFNAVRNPDENASDQWICGARDVLETAASATESRDLGTDGELSIEFRETVLRRWRDAAQMLQRGTTCDSSLSAPGARPSS